MYEYLSWALACARSLSDIREENCTFQQLAMPDIVHILIENTKLMSTSDF